MKNQLTAAKIKIPHMIRIFCVLGTGLLFQMSVTQTFALPNERFQKLGVQLDDWSSSQIQFWFKVFTEYSTQQAILHDPVNLKHVYAVVENKASAISKEKNKINHGLTQIYRKQVNRKKIDPHLLTEADKKYFQIQERSEDPQTYYFAAQFERIRVQVGQKDRLKSATAVSVDYLSRMEEMFEEEGVPKELTRLPFVESAFESQAQSKSGAIGIWQFMPKTAQKDLRLDRVIDERYDPLKSTRAAARFLRKNYDHFKNWGLAIMAYHHGPGLLDQAVKRLNTHDPLKIIRLFKSPNFQFASRNYLFEFLAILDADQKKETQLKERTQGLPSFITISFPEKKFIRQILTEYKINERETKFLNPHFRETIWSGSHPIPAHYPIRLAGITLEKFRNHKLLSNSRQIR